MTEHEKKQIEEEENYRFEVRKSIEKRSKDDPSSKLWVFLNSSFGLWLFSTVVVGFVVNFYTRYQDNVAERNKKMELTRKLNVEISSRLQNMFTLLQDKVDGSVENAGRLRYRLTTSFLPPSANSGQDEWNVYPDYKDLSLESLLRVFLASSFDNSEKDSVKSAIIILNRIKNDAIALPPFGSEDSRLSVTDSNLIKKQNELIAAARQNNELIRKKYQEILLKDGILFQSSSFIRSF